MHVNDDLGLWAGLPDHGDKLREVVEVDDIRVLPAEIIGDPGKELAIAPLVWK